MADTRDIRIAPLSVRVTASERDEIDRLAAKAGLSRNGYIRRAALCKPVPLDKLANEKLLVTLLGAAARIQDQLRDLAMAGADAGDPLSLEQARDELGEIRAALIALLARR